MPAVPLVRSDAARASQEGLARLVAPLGSRVGTTAVDDDVDGVPTTPLLEAVQVPDVGAASEPVVPVVRSVVWSRVTCGGRIWTPTLSKAPRELLEPMPTMPLFS